MSSRNRGSLNPDIALPSRRTFVKGLAMGGVVAGLGLWRDSAWAQTGPRHQPVVLSGTEFDLKIGDFPPTLLSIDTVVAAVVGAVVLSLVSTAVRLVVRD